MGTKNWLREQVNRHPSLSGLSMAKVGRMIASEFQIPESTVENWVKGKRDPDSFKRPLIQKYLGRLATEQNTVTANSPLSQGKIFKGKRTF